MSGERCVAPLDCWCTCCDPEILPDPLVYVVTGGRKFDNPTLVDLALGCITEPSDVIVDGGAAGLDTLARQWAVANSRQSVTVLAEWDKHGRRAGPMRNYKMLARGDVRALIAFPGGAGTRNCIEQAEKMGITVVRVGLDFKPTRIS